MPTKLTSKTMMNRPLRLVAVILLPATACSDGAGPGNQAVASVLITTGADTLSPAEATAFGAAALTASGDPVLATFGWSSSNPSVATVDAQGNVTAVAPGSTTITAAADGRQATATLAVVRTWKMVSAGQDAICGITLDDRAWCWGQNFSGQLGNGSMADATAPAPVAGGALWLDVHVGKHSACGTTTDGRALCWGSYNKQSFSGVAMSPAAIDQAPALAAVRAGVYAGCGLTGAGAAWCWGRDTYGGLGDGNPGGITTYAVPVAGGLAWQSVQPGGLDVTCGLTVAGAAWCWGQGILGGASGASPTPQVVAGGRVFSSLATWFNGACAIDAGGTAWCWGQGDQGTIGNGTSANADLPAAVTGNLHFTQLAAGEAQVCGLVAGGDAYCWGNGVTEPALVPGGHKFAAVSTGGFQACGLTAGGAAWCWGTGPLGNGSAGASTVPVRVGHPAGAPIS